MEVIPRDMERSQLLLVAAVAGFAIMLAGFAGYVIDPQTYLAALFIVGLILLIASYALLSMENKRVSAEVEAVNERESAEGYVYYMYGAPEDNPATIVDLREI